MRARAASVLLLVAVCGVWERCAGGAGGVDVARALVAPARYILQSTVLSNAAERRDSDLGYRLQGALTVRARSHGDGDMLLRLQLEDMQLLVRGAHRSAEWEARDSLRTGAPWLVRVRGGSVRALHLPSADNVHVRNYKRAISSLLQFQLETVGEAGEGGVGVERNETDASGECGVYYERAGGGSYRRVKRWCAADLALHHLQLAARRLTRYSIAPGGGSVREIHSEEVVTLHGALKLRSWHALQREGELHAGKWEKEGETEAEREGLESADLPLEAPPSHYDEDELVKLSAAIEANSAALTGEQAGAGGDEVTVRALLALLPALRRASQPELSRALVSAPPERLPALCRALGLAGTGAAARAAAEFLHLGTSEPLEPLAHDYLAGLALSNRADGEAVLLALRAAESGRPERVVTSALLAAAAAARTAADRAAVGDALVKGLARCTEERCRAVRLQALGNLRTRAADLLVGEAERGGGRAALAALEALRGAEEVSGALLARLGALVVNGSLALEVRAAALEAVVLRRVAHGGHGAPLQLVRLAGALHTQHGAAAHELRRVLWSRLDALRTLPAVRALLALLPTELRTWDARAHSGTSHVLRRDTGWGAGAGGWRALLDSVQLAAGGLLRRGVVTLLTHSPEGELAPELEVEVWTRGLQALAGGGGGEEGAGEEEPVAGGLALSVGGARLPDITLFDGQAELLGHVWSGSGSTPTTVMRAAREVRRGEGALPLAGGCWARVRSLAAVSLALDAHAAVSLWQRTARGALELRAALVGEAGARMVTPWARVEARREVALEPRLRIALALDFYSGVSVCVRAAVPEHAVRTRLALGATCGARRHNVTRGASSTRVVPGRTLALGRANDAACRTLQPDDDDE